MAEYMKSTAPDKARTQRGKVAAKGLELGVKAVTLIALLGLYYVIVFFTAVQVVPMVMGFVKSGTGVTLDMPLETVLSFWIVPALFLVGLLFALVLVTIRALWRFRNRFVAAAVRWISGEDATEAVAAPMGVAVKKTRAKNVTHTKAA